MKSVFLTGATGFIGRHTIEPLLKRNFVIHALYSSTIPHIEHPQLYWHQGDIHDKQVMDDLMRKIKPSHLLHAAWYTKPNDYWNSPINEKWMRSSMSLLDSFCREQGERAVFVGTCAEYDWQQRICNEIETPCHPKSIYGKAKLSLKEYTDKVAKNNSNISIAWGRIFFLFGPYEYPQRLLPSAITKLLQQGIFMVNNGDQVRDFMYVADVADALVAILDSDISGAVNIASGKPMTIRDIILKTANMMHASEFIQFREIDTSIKSNDAEIRADVSRLFNEVQWTPAFTLDLAIDNTIAWWRKRI